MELAEEDLDFGLDEEEEREWAAYDEDVRQYQQLMSSVGMTADELREAAVARSDEAAQSGGSGASFLGQAPEGLTDDEVSRLEEVLGNMELDVGQEAARQGEQAQGEPPLREFLKETRRGPAAAQAGGAEAGGWQPGLGSAGSSYDGLPEEYRDRLASDEGGIVVSGELGRKTVVLLSRLPDQRELLPVLSETFRLQGVKILRGWLQESSSGVVTDAFEVCDMETGDALSEGRSASLKVALTQAAAEPTMKQVLFELSDQVPNLAAFLFMPTGDLSPPPLAAAQDALGRGPFVVREARDLGRALLFRGDLTESARGNASGALADCQQLLDDASPESAGQWECLLARGTSDLVILALPVEDLKKSLEPPFTIWLVFLIFSGVTALYCESVAPATQNTLPVTVGVLLFNIVGASELARRIVADFYGIRLLPPFLLPSTSIGTFGAATRAVSVLPNARAQFDMAAAASLTMLVASTLFILLGLVVPLSGQSCAWTNPGVFPELLRTLLNAQAETLADICVERPAAAATGFLPSSPAVIAGCCGILAAALNILPFGSCTDGSSIARCAPAGRVRDTFLPLYALVLLILSIFGNESAESDALFPAVLAWAVFAFGLRPYLVGDPVLRDNITEPDDVLRRVVGFILLSISFGVFAAGVFGKLALTLLR